MTIKYPTTDASKRHPLQASAKKLSEQEYKSADDLDFDKLTPTWKKFTPKFNSAVEAISKALTSGNAPSFGELETLARTLITHEQDTPIKDFIGMAFQYLEEATEGEDDISDAVRRGLVPLFLAILESSSSSATSLIETEKSRLKPLIEGNKAKLQVSTRAKELASAMWTDDTANEIKTSEMADKVWSKLIDEGFSDRLPDSADRVKVWIRSVAPDYAKAKGRPKKRLA
ncbi:hypothetical protein [Pseudomonas sp. W5-01]|uniref:hypothetical protein n=1 Tax=Pseudomonas sp. W5-01 TaxID=3097454 RepID=UPI003978B07B